MRSAERPLAKIALLSPFRIAHRSDETMRRATSSTESPSMEKAHRFGHVRYGSASVTFAHSFSSWALSSAEACNAASSASDRAFSGSAASAALHIPRRVWFGRRLLFSRPSFVRGLVILVPKSHLRIAARSYVWPSEETAGCIIRLCVTGHSSVSIVTKTHSDSCRFLLQRDAISVEKVERAEKSVKTEIFILLYSFSPIV